MEESPPVHDMNAMEVLPYTDLVKPPDALVAPLSSASSGSSPAASPRPSETPPPTAAPEPDSSTPAASPSPPPPQDPTPEPTPPPSSSSPSPPSPAVTSPPSSVSTPATTSPPGSNPGSPRAYDRYGFSVGEASASDAVLFFRSAKRQQAVVEKEMQRVTKWLTMMSDWNKWSTKRAPKVKNRIRKGIPDRVRGKAWQLIATSSTLPADHPNLYSTLVAAECSASEEISRDITRTFPTHEAFRDNPQLATTTLHSVLKAFAVYDPEVGYCQGMGFVAALLLFYMPEEQAFWMLTRLLSPRYNMAGLFRPGLPLVHMHTWQLERLLEKRHPKMIRHLTAEGVMVSVVATKWFLTNFAYTFPFATTIRVWDIYLNEGVSIIFRVSVALFDALRPTIMASRMEDLYALFADIPAKFLNPDKLIGAALKIPLKPATLDKLARAYQETVHAEEAARSRRASRRIIPSANALQSSASGSSSKPSS